MTDFFTPAGRGVQHSNLRAANRRAVLTTIALSPGISNADVSRRTGLAPQTASAIVTELEAEGLIGRGTVLRGRRGQPATPLFINADAGFSIGCEISWQHMAVVLIDLSSQEIDRIIEHYDSPDPGTIVNQVAAAVARVQEKLPPAHRERVQGIGLTMPSHIGRSADADVSPARHKQAWTDLDVARQLEAVTGLPTLQFIAGNAGSWAELLTHAAPRPSNFIYLFVHTHLETGFIAGPSQWDGPAHNSANLSAALGVALVERRYNASLPTLAELRRRLLEAGHVAPTGCPRDWPWDEWSAVVAPWIKESGLSLAETIANTANVIATELAVIDGPLPRPILERLVAATAAGLAQLSEPPVTPARVVVGSRGPGGMALGAGQLAMIRRMFARPSGEIMG